ncbi:MAG: hypothetical protein WCO22_07430 [Betaproteobacteria bacterium]
MSDLTSILRQSKKALAVLGASATLGLASYFALAAFLQKDQTELASVQSERAASETDLTAKQAELAMFKSNFSRFEALQQKGLVGVAKRDDWVEDLVKAHQRAKLPLTLGYDLLAPRALVAANAAPNAGVASGATIAPVELHELDVSLDSIHEVELIQFLNRYQDEVRGRYRLQSCVLSSPRNSGLSANCRLYFFNQPLTPASAARTP